MTLSDEHLSAYLDGELSADQTREVDAMVAADPAVAAALERLMATDTAVKAAFDEMLTDPVPFELAAAIRSAPDPEVAPAATAAPRGFPGWAAIAASVGFLAVGGLGGYTLGQNEAPQVVASTPGWLNEIAAYHGVYETQVRHLVEVRAEERDHIETWLGNTTGVEFAVPDLSASGLTFQGARLLVAGGAPVAQLVYTDAAGAVFALCLKTAKAPADKDFTAETVGGFDMVSWRSGGADYVVVGPEGTADLTDIAQTAALSV
ncbi:MAG: anti-sigma factor [Pseudomonadota bacterium]